MTRADNTRFPHPAERHQATLKKASDAIARLDSADQPVNFSSVAAAAGVSRDLTQLTCHHVGAVEVPARGVSTLSAAKIIFGTVRFHQAGEHADSRHIRGSPRKS
jgi:hypothetical protein